MAAAVEQPGEENWAREYWQRRESKARSDTHAYVVRDRGVLVGFMLFSVRELDGWICALLESGFVRPEYQRRGVGFGLCARVVHRVFWKHPWRQFLWVSELINPVILRAWTSRFPRSTEMLPARFGTRSADLERLAPLVAARLFPENDYDPETSVLTGRTTPRPPIDTWSGDVSTDEYFSAHVHPETGDSLLYLAAFRRTTILRGLGQLAGATWRLLDRRLRSRPEPARSGSAGSGR